MTLEEQLRRTFETLAIRLRDEVVSHLTSSLVELNATAESERAEAVAEAARDAWSSAERETTARVAAAVASADMRARAEIEASERAGNDRLLGAFRSMDRARSLTDILDALVTTAAAEAARAAIFLTEGAQLRSWRL